jgi:hypothetical protein
MYRKNALVITQNCYFSSLLRFTKNHVIGNSETVTDVIFFF